MSNRTTGARRPRSNKIALAALGTTMIMGAAAVAATGGPVSGNGWEGVAVLHDVDGNKVGKVKFKGDQGRTVVKVAVSRVAVGPDTYHGLHVHANDSGGACDPAAASGPFTDVGGHWNPTAAVHGAHAGDLPSLLVLADGSATARSVTGRFDPAAIEGRAVILHAGPDNFANVPTRYVTGDPAVGGPDAATKGTGDAGGRIACGIVELR